MNSYTQVTTKPFQLMIVQLQKRKVTTRKSETKSASTVYSEEAGGVVLSDNGALEFVSNHPSSLPGQKIQKDTTVEEEVLCSDSIKAPAAPAVTLGTPPPAATKQNRCETIEEEVMVSEKDFKSEIFTMKGHQVQRNGTIEEEINMCTKPRSMSLTETISQELNQSMFGNGEIKL